MIRSPFSKIDRKDEKPTAAGIVDYGLGEAYEIVKFVHDNLDTLFTVQAMSEQFDTIINNIANFGNYALIDHSHSLVYAAIDHDHAGYALSEHVHSEYAAADHVHVGDYQPAGDYALAGHTHDLDYISSELINAANGVAPLDNSLKVPWGNLPDITKDTVGLSQVDNTSDVDKPISTAQQNALSLLVPASVVGAADGVASLDANAKLPVGQLPAGTVLDPPADGYKYSRSNGAWTLTYYSVPFGFIEAPASGDKALLHIFSEAGEFPDNFAGAQSYVGVLPSGDVTFTIDIISGGVPTTIGTIVITAAGAITFDTVGAAVNFAIGDLLTVTATTDTLGMSNAAFTLRGLRK